MNLKNQTADAWSKKSNKELRELVSKGVSEVNKRARTTVNATEKQFIEDIKNMQGITKKGEIKRTTNKITRKELIYRARKIDRYLKTDKSSKEGIQQLTEITKEAKSTFESNNPDINLSELQFREMVELMGAFKDATEGMDSEQIKAFFDASKNKISANELASIFGKAEMEFKGTGATTSQKMAWVFDEIDKLAKTK